MSQPTWHILESDDVLQRLDSYAMGLSHIEVQKHLFENALNVMAEKKQCSLLVILRGLFAEFMIVVLLFAALISGFIVELQDTIAILVIGLLNAL